MKIPETSANVGAYYGNEENGQWQPNGVIVDSGVGGGVVGSGDAGAHPPSMYPVHVRHGHIPGYVMAGAYYPPAPYGAPPAQLHDDFEDYMWMENEEEFDKQVMQQLEEEALMEQCIEAMLEDEQRERLHRPAAANGHPTRTSNGVSSLSLEEAVSRSTLNPLAAEFVPTTVRLPPPVQTPAEKTPPSPPEAPASETKATEESTKSTSQLTEEVATEAPGCKPVEGKSEEPSPPKTETPEVSALDVHPITETNAQTNKHADAKTKPTPKKPARVDSKHVKEVREVKEVKAKKSTPVKVESKPVAKAREVKAVKSEDRADETPVIEQSPPPPTEEPQSGFKPINYAAAAKANKPKKPLSATTNEKTPPPATVAEKTSSVSVKATSEKAPVKATATAKAAVRVTADKREKVAPKGAKTVVQRKNSAK